MTKTIRHLLIVAPSFPKNEENDIVIPPLNLYVRQLKNDYPNLKISIVTIHFPFHQNVYDLWGATIHPCGGANGSLLTRPLIWKKAKSIIKNIHQSDKIDLVQSFWLNESPLVAKKFCKKFSIPHFCTLMGQDALQSNKYIRFFTSKSPQLVCLSNFQKNILESHSPIKAQAVIPWGIRPTEFQKKDFSERAIDLICVSSLIPLKQVELFVKVVERVKSSYPNINAMIIGGGGLKNDILKLITQLNLSQNIKLAGLLPRQEVLMKMQESKILVHTSSYEAQGYVLNEGLASGCHVLTLSKGLEVNNDKFEIVSSQQKLEEKIVDLLKNKNLSHQSEFPITMKDTIKMYEKLFLTTELSF